MSKAFSKQDNGGGALRKRCTVAVVLFGRSASRHSFLEKVLDIGKTSRWA